MAWSWKIGRLAGINVYVHWTFMLLIAFIVYLFISQGSSGAAAALGVLFVLAVFGCVVLHELGHALAARRYGVPTRDITLLPIGGVARMQRMPEHPEQELVVAIAGPLVNVAIGVFLAVLLLALGGLSEAFPTGLLEVGRGNFLANLMWVNFILVLFNLLPAFPMDGGRVLRSLLAMWLDYTTATAIAAGAGQIMAILFGLFGLLSGNPILIFIALFVFLGASAETQQAQIRSLLGNVPVEEAMLSRFRTLATSDTLDKAVNELLAGSQQDFPVFEDDQYVGMLVRKNLLENLNSHGREYAIAGCVSRDCPSANYGDSLDDVIRKMQEAGCSTVPVFAGGQFAGVLTLENIGEYMLVRSALQGNRKHSSAAGR
ncbi:site-2 protease family protein [Candidatus Laterigemmans baculatus]|uniref:site-2 protease family protein n=1 Tax=Candidatus Laterigemmans baculatus TaxID=2770505 RepID=UPI0013DC6E04|nr:site-2 protease family protein [Candidatus Laterigemmans baculatus]